MRPFPDPYVRRLTWYTNYDLLRYGPDTANPPSRPQPQACGCLRARRLRSVAPLPYILYRYRTGTVRWDRTATLIFY